MAFNVNTTDISKMKLDNKSHNIEFLLRPKVFRQLAITADCLSDTNLAYVPWFYNQGVIKTSDDKTKIVEFIEPCAENNYSDLSFIDSSNKYINFKACRVKTLEAIHMDGSLLTYAENTINEYNFLVFYSLRLNESNKILVLSTKFYEFLCSHNDNKHVRYFNFNDISKFTNFGFKSNEMSLLDISNEKKLDDVSEKNLSIKRKACIETLIRICQAKKNNNDSVGKVFGRTHFGCQYSAFNLITGETRNFRDVVARNNFFKMKNIKLTSNRNISKNCKIMDNIFNNISVDSYSLNILDESGWIISKYIADTDKFINYIKSVLSETINKSKRMFARISKILSNSKQNLILMISIIHKTTITLWKHLKEKLSYYRPYHLYRYISDNLENSVSYYLEKYPYMKKQLI
jgi:hypothetical protein